MRIPPPAWLLVCCLLSVLRLQAAADVPQEAAPDFGPNVLIFEPAQAGAQERIDAVFKLQEAAQFGTERKALLFKPGKYALRVPVGFYTQVSGLGLNPDDVDIQGSLIATAAWMRYNATCNFWRCVENLSVTPLGEDKDTTWSVSQGTALRRLHLRGGLRLSEKGWSSGGFLADCLFDGTVKAGTQQQWFSRNSRWQAWERSHGWNMVFVGCPEAPKDPWPEFPITAVTQAPVVQEKPYLHVDAAGRYFVRVPALHAEPSAGTHWEADARDGRSIPLSEFHVARADRDDAASLNRALAVGRHLLLTPGQYRLSEPLVVVKPGTIVLGLGYATLIPVQGTEALVVDQPEGVILSGLLIDASLPASRNLVRIGRAGQRSGSALAPTVVHDLYTRVGGGIPGAAESMVEIHASHVIGDNLWLWRADHGNGVAWDRNPNKVGLLVSGDDVTTYGLAVEHTQEFQVLWKGERGRVFFYQSEMPYDPPSQAAWGAGGVKGFASYKLAEGVSAHEAWGVGVYCIFHHGPIVADNGIEAPTGPGIRMHHLFTFKLGGRQPGSGILHVISGRGDPVVEKRVSHVE